MFTDEEIEGGEHYTALGKIEIKCSVCNERITIYANDLRSEGEE